MIRRAEPRDRAAVEAIVRAAYSIYIARLGKSGGPMLDDYAKRIEAGTINVFEETGGAIVGLGVLAIDRGSYSAAVDHKLPGRSEISSG